MTFYENPKYRKAHWVTGGESLSRPSEPKPIPSKSVRKLLKKLRHKKETKT